MAAKKKEISLARCLAFNLKAIRENAGVSQSDLARVAGIAQPTISDIERGERGASFHMVATLARALKVDPRKLLASEGVEP